MKKIIIYSSAGNQVNVKVEFDGDTVWLSLKQIAELFERDKSVISRHLKNIYETGELVRELTVAKKATVDIEGKREISRQIEYYNLDAILSVGYRVNSKKGTEFRKWANQVNHNLVIEDRKNYSRKIKRFKQEYEERLDSKQNHSI